MSTIAQNTAPGLGRQMLLTVIVSLLLGGAAGGLVSWAAQPGVQSESAPAITSGKAADTAPTFSPELIRARNYRAPNK